MKRKSLILLFIMVFVISNLSTAFAGTEKNTQEVKENEVTRTWKSIDADYPVGCAVGLK